MEGKKVGEGREEGKKKGGRSNYDAVGLYHCSEIAWNA